jgi:hypothetical protein
MREQVKEFANDLPSSYVNEQANEWFIVFMTDKLKYNNLEL